MAKPEQAPGRLALPQATVPEYLFAMRFNTPRGFATFAWQSDYGQFYLVDCEDNTFLPPQEFTAALEARSLFVPPAGLVIYTADCLQQHINVTVYDAEPDHPPAEPMSGEPWTRQETVEARFPSRRFALSSPFHLDPLPYGPFFLLAAETMTVRISWKEFQGSRDDSVPVEPDVIDLVLWPST